MSKTRSLEGQRKALFEKHIALRDKMFFNVPKIIRSLDDLRVSLFSGERAKNWTTEEHFIVHAKSFIRTYEPLIKQVFSENYDKE